MSGSYLFDLLSPDSGSKNIEYYQDSYSDDYADSCSDAGKADMITRKVLINLQWSGDGVYTLDQADIDDFPLAFAVPEEATNIYFDG